MRQTTSILLRLFFESLKSFIAAFLIFTTERPAFAIHFFSFITHNKKINISSARLDSTKNRTYCVNQTQIKP